MRFAGEVEEDGDEEFPDHLLDDDHLDGEYDDDEGDNDDDEGGEGGEGGSSRFRKGGAKDAAVGPLSAEAREALELQFEKTMAEYDDDEIGYLSDVSALLV